MEARIRELRKRRAELTPILGSHGLSLREDVLSSTSLSILDGLQTPRRQTNTTARLRRTLDDIDDLVRQRRPNRRRTADKTTRAP